VSAHFHDVASAALPVAIVLLLLAAAARVAVWQRIGGSEERLARAYLEPLALWSLGAFAVHVVAIGAAGEAGVVSVGVPLVLGAVAALLHPAGEAVARQALEADDHPPAPARPPAAAAPARPAAAPRPAPAPTSAAPSPAPRTPAPAAPATPAAAPADDRAPGGALWADGDDDERSHPSGLWSRA
jgi:hypothetical protein